MKSRPAWAQSATGAADLILHNGRITTLDRQIPEAQAVAIRGGRFVAVGTDQELMARADAATKRIDLKARRDSRPDRQPHAHYSWRPELQMELRWDGVRSLADAMRMLRQQVDRTPRRSGFGSSRVYRHQFAEKRLPTLEEINAISPDTPVFILHLYDARS